MIQWTWQHDEVYVWKMKSLTQLFYRKHHHSIVDCWQVLVCSTSHCLAITFLLPSRSSSLHTHHTHTHTHTPSVDSLVGCLRCHALAKLLRFETEEDVEEDKAPDMLAVSSVAQGIVASVVLSYVAVQVGENWFWLILGISGMACEKSGFFFKTFFPKSMSIVSFFNQYQLANSLILKITGLTEEGSN